MPELRYNATTKEWVIIATERAKRPEDFSAKPAEPARDTAANCPFCPGKEDKTPKEVFAIRDANSSGWRVRVIPNAFPALSSEGEPLQGTDANGYLRMNGVGIHEVIIESPEHDQAIATMDPVQVENIFHAYKQRYEVLSRDPRFKAVILFKNHGARAGTSLRHPHSQVIATPVVPRIIEDREEIAREYYEKNHVCLYCHMVETEKKDGRRVILETENFIVFSPFASRFPFEAWIFPKCHASSYLRITEGQNKELSEVVHKTLKKYYSALKNPDFNYAIYSSPQGEEDVKHFHWNLKIFPRISTPGGFEVGSGIIVNTAVPEATAKYLREA